MSAITQNGLLLQYASERLKHNRKFVQKAVFNNHHVLPYLPKEFQTDLLILNEIAPSNLTILQKKIIDQKNKTLAAVNETSSLGKHSLPEIDDTIQQFLGGKRKKTKRIKTINKKTLKK
jgi:hypothetical protein